MSCREVVEFLADYLSGELAPAQRAAFDSHLRECPDCVVYLESYRQAVTMGKSAGDLPADDLAGELPEELVQAVLAARRKPR